MVTGTKGEKSLTEDADNSIFDRSNDTVCHFCLFPNR